LAEIARLCDDLPLALRLAAADMMGRSPAERARHLAGLPAVRPVAASGLSTRRCSSSQRREVFGRRGRV
ncbi:MAG: hypothetical protein HOW59_29800, partial [Nonomuraea sp.]|nr:hypothetical protein [Nonomuraea sp.]